MTKKEQKEDKGSPFLRGAIIPAATMGAGLFAGSLLGGTAGKALVNTPRFRQFLRNASPEKRKKLLQMIAPVSTAIGAAGGAGTSAILYSVMQDELEKRRKHREKTAMFLACLSHLEELQ